MHTTQLNVHSAEGSLLFIEDRYVYVYIVMLSIICNVCVVLIIMFIIFSFSISAVDVWPKYVITAPSAS